MTEKEVLFAIVSDKIKSCTDNYMITNTNFFDSFQQSEVNSFLSKSCPVKYEFYGGFDAAERRMVVFLPDYISGTDYFRSNESDNPIKIIKITKDNFSSLTHRDYLGAIMGLGIKRETVGDIAVNNNGCTVAVCAGIADYICKNLIFAGRGSVKAEICSDSDFLENEEHFEIKRCYVQSMRADSVVGAAFGLSRSTAAEKILHGDVIVNSLIITKPDAHIAFGSKLVIHGKGKVIIDEDAGITKKGRQAFLMKKYC